MKLYQSEMEKLAKYDLIFPKEHLELMINEIYNNIFYLEDFLEHIDYEKNKRYIYTSSKEEIAINITRNFVLNQIEYFEKLLTPVSKKVFEECIKEMIIELESNSEADVGNTVAIVPRKESLRRDDLESLFCKFNHEKYELSYEYDDSCSSSTDLYGVSSTDIILRLKIKNEDIE
jgi:hypothetical protein